VTRPHLLSETAVHFVPMQIEDLDAVLAIEYQSFTTPWSRELFVTELDNSRVAHLFVARLGDKPEDIVGYIGYRVVIDEMHIVIIAVHPAWRRRGIARYMLGEAMAHARRGRCTKATLEVRVSNVGAQQLYYRLGFAPVGSRPRYYMRPSEDALILWRDPL
jgi:[ribosomal protein S18]-alanine N-acetyltransferase